MKRSIALVFILFVGCDFKIKDPPFTPPPEPKGFDASLCPKFQKGYYDKDTKETVRVESYGKSILIRDNDIDFIIDGEEYQMSADSTYVGGCLNGYATVMIKSKNKDEAKKEIYTQIFFAPSGKYLDRGVLVNFKPQGPGTRLLPLPNS